MNTPTKSGFELSLLPSVLTACVVVVGGALAAFFPLSLVMLYAAILPLPLLLLWQARDVESPQDRIAAVDAERARAKMLAIAARPAEPEMARAA